MTADIRQLDDSISVAGQLTPDHIATAAEAGFRMIVNNRPDGEEPGQPREAEIAAAAAANGLGYAHIPVTHAGIAPGQVEAMRTALAAADGPVLAFCRSGTRSTFLWALSQAGSEDRDVLMQKAAAAGYDLSPLAGRLG